jgi:hypothetical protein
MTIEAMRAIEVSIEPEQVWASAPEAPRYVVDRLLVGETAARYVAYYQENCGVSCKFPPRIFAIYDVAIQWCKAHEEAYTKGLL